MTTKQYDGDNILKDGEVLNVPMLLMDHAPPQITRHAPGAMIVGDADRDERERTIETRKQQLSEAWRSPVAQQADLPTEPPADVDAAYEAREQRLVNAWKGGA
ncbi:hypothetical protein J2W51_000328 [Tardiphaga robiniae]|uniref:hypothetical protein n=1 Tax=Tardiphaga robiniae TaxID=943830 RepID=UPI0028584532|nr:hypothetical protein [Tardiphaga robiniae]MDR6657786.1 hypothetical protein [Tardiphaga robiniae]